MYNNGLQNELDIVNVLDGKTYKELPEFWQAKMRQLYRIISDDDKIECYKCVHDQKSDISIKVGTYKWNISIKSGGYVSVHEERISTFVGFLRSLGINEKLLDTLKLYHYGDGTLDGTGDVHKDLDTIKKEMCNEIEAFNKAVNEPEILYRIIMRFICCGTPIQRSYVTHIYYGNHEDGMMLNAKTIVEYICSGYASNLTSIHFGPFIYTPGYRGLENFDKNNVRRYYIKIKWPSLIRDMREAKEWYFKNRDLNKEKTIEK